MANYNSGIIYNKLANDGGALYNSATYVLTFKLNDSFNAGDAVTRLLAISVVYESARLADSAVPSARYSLAEELEFAQDQMRGYAVFRIADAFKATDAVSSVLATLLATDRFKMLDNVSKLETMLSAVESVSLNEASFIRTLIRAIDSVGISDVSTYQTVLYMRDLACATDSDEPRTAIADYIIGDPTQVGVGSLDAAFDWIMPFGLMMDWAQSVIPRAPEAESDEIKIAGVHGETLEHTTYRNRPFKIVAWSEDDLTQQEKDLLVRQITEILDATLDQPKKLTFARTGVSFDVKYDGELAVEEGPSFVRAIIPLNASAYGYSQFDKQLSGSGLIQNSGVARIGVLNKITGECVNPAFTLGDVEISWTGTVPAGSKLYIDHGKEVCYLEDAWGNTTNARQYMSGEFVTIPVGGTIIVTANTSTETHLVTNWHDKFLW